MENKRLARLMKKNIKKFEGKTPDEYVICSACKMKCINLSLHIRRVHDEEITIEEYKELYPNDDWWPLSYRLKQSEKFKGSKNPGFQHGGKLSPFSKKSGRTEDEISESISKAASNRSYTSRLDYWLERTDGDLNRARELLSERQSTFSMDKLIKTHGEEEAKRIWSTRQEKWLRSLEENFTPSELRALKIEGMKKTGRYIMQDDPRLDEWTAYKRLVESYTRKTISLYPSIKVNIGRNKNHIDHKFSVKRGFLEQVDPKIIGSVVNLESISSSENCSKKDNCSIDIISLEENYERFISDSRAKVYREYRC